MSASVVLFGGTFDPPHRAHVELPQCVCEQLGCDRIIYVPTSMNPLKTDRPTTAEHRFNMLQLALQNCRNCEISRIELDHTGPSYTVETLAQLRERLAERFDGLDRLYLLMGTDAALSFPRWRQPERILELATPVVMLRPPNDRERFARELRAIYPPALAERWVSWTVDVPMLDVDATTLRERLERGEDPGDAIDPAVLSYIHKHNLYRA